MQPEIVLTFVDEAGRTQSVAVGPGRFTVGRGTDNDLSVGDSNLSRRHAVIERAGGSVTISDCGSRNGTAVNDHPVHGAAELSDGDRVTLGIDKHGQYWITDDPDPGPIRPDALATRLQAAYAARGERGNVTLYLKADDRASYAVVMRALDSARQVGVRHVAMITRE